MQLRRIARKLSLGGLACVQACVQACAAAPEPAFVSPHSQQEIASAPSGAAEEGLPGTAAATDLDPERAADVAEAGADELWREADAAVRRQDFDAATDAIQRCEKVEPRHTGCDEVWQLVICETWARDAERDGDLNPGLVVEVWDELSELREHSSTRVRECAERNQVRIQPIHEKAVAAIKKQNAEFAADEARWEAEERHEAAVEAFRMDVARTEDQLWNYVLASYMVRLGLTDLSRDRAKEVRTAMKRAACPAWRKAAKEHGKTLVKPAITSYCAESFPHSLCNSYTETCTEIEIADCERLVTNMCGW